MMHEVSAIILAAGQSRRFGSHNKLYTPIDGKPMIIGVIERVLAAQPDQCFVVVSAQDKETVNLCSDFRVTAIPCADASLGMAHSLRAGAHAAPTTHGLMIVLGDMPFIRISTIERVITTARNAHSENTIVMPFHEGRRGHPIVFGAGHRANLLALEGDRGANNLIADNPGQCTHVCLNDPGIHRDIDRPYDLESPTEV
ncbi:MAG: nucleotidyltransferase family protein [Pseudomonadota bacterium]